jgi:hypothetical protein
MKLNLKALLLTQIAMAKLAFGGVNHTTMASRNRAQRRLAVR